MGHQRRGRLALPGWQLDLRRKSTRVAWSASNESITLAPDGTVWAAGNGGVAYRGSGPWIVADTHAAGAVTVDREGTVWVAGTLSPCDIWSLRPSGSGWTRTSAGCPFRFGGGGHVRSMAVDGRGALWVGAAGFVVNAMARYADGRWEAKEARAGLPNDITVNVLGVSANGDVWIDFQAASTATHARARFDGAAWTVISGAADMAVAVAPDGAKWASALARYDWKGLEGSARRWRRRSPRSWSPRTARSSPWMLSGASCACPL